MISPRRRLLLFVAGTPLAIALFGWIYMTGMNALEDEPRSFAESFEWASETLTTTGYGRDNHWTHPAMVAFVTFVQVLGGALWFIVATVVFVPYFEARFEGRLPRTAPPRLRDYVLVYRWGPAVAPLVDELGRAKVPVVVLEEDEAVARRLIDRGRVVVHARLDESDPDPRLIERARAIVANGTDEQNGAFVLGAHQQGFRGDIVALAQQPLHRAPLMLAGASAVYTPLHILGAAMASLASERISPRVSGLGHLGDKIHSIELRIDRGSDLAGHTIADADIRRRTGATIIAQWQGGVFLPHPPAGTLLEPGAILVAVGGERSLAALGKLARPLQSEGAVVVCGFGEVGRKVTELLRDAGEQVVVIDRAATTGVDVVGDVLNRSALERAGVATARTVVLSLGDDSTTLFAVTVLRDFAAEVPIVARVNRSESIERIHRAGADFALSLGEVAAELLAQKLLGDDWLSLEARVKLIKVPAGRLAGSTPHADRIGQRTGCSIVAVERDGEVLTELDGDFRIDAGDQVIVCGPEQGVARYLETFRG